MKTYTDAEILDLMDWFARAAMLVGVDAAKGRDEGTCVIGAGIAIWRTKLLRTSRTRASARLVVIPAPFQGNTGSRKACERALAYLRQVGVECEWYDGNMD